MDKDIEKNIEKSPPLSNNSDIDSVISENSDKQQPNKKARIRAYMVACIILERVPLCLCRHRLM